MIKVKVMIPSNLVYLDDLKHPALFETKKFGICLKLNDRRFVALNDGKVRCILESEDPVCIVEVPVTLTYKREEV